MSEYDTYNQFCIDNINKAEDAQLLYDHVGTSQLQFVPAGFWLHPSRTSACIAFQTNLPAKGRVECATGQVPPEDEREFNLHIYHITGLALDSEHNYTIHAKRGAQEIEQSGSFSTATPPGAILITPTDGNDITLDQDDAIYILTTDWDADGRAFTINRWNITLDLDGHQVSYDNLPDPSPDPYGVYCDYNLKSVTIQNGRILQGPQQSSAPTTGRGANPIRSHTSPMIVRGLHARWGGVNVPGTAFAAGGSGHTISHCVFLDEGTGIQNRHQAVRAVDLIGSNDISHDTKIDNVLVKRCRHRGIDTRESEATINNCEVWQDSWAANAYGIYAPRVYDCFGYLAGYWAGAHAWQRARPVDLQRNYVNGYGVPNDRHDEYGTMSNLNGFRLTYYLGNDEDLNDNLVAHNTVVLRGIEGALLRGVGWSQDKRAVNNMIRDNVFKVFAEDEGMPTTGNTTACITLHGNEGEQHVPHAISSWLRNTCISNVAMVVFGESYGSGSNTQWHNNRFERLGSYSHFHTIRNIYNFRESIDNNFHNTTTINCEMDDYDVKDHIGFDMWYNVYPDGYRMEATESGGPAKVPLEVTEHELLTEADEAVLLEDGTLKVLLESASPLVVQPVRPYVYTPRRAIGTRPARFTLDPTHTLRNGLILAQMGNVLSSNTSHESSFGVQGARVGNALRYEHMRGRPVVHHIEDSTSFQYPTHARNMADQYTVTFQVQTAGINHHHWIYLGSGGGQRLAVIGNTGGRVIVMIRGANGLHNATSVANLLPANIWQHFIITYPGGDMSNAKIYVNGVDRAESSTGDPGTLVTPDTGFIIGRRWADSGQIRLADVMIWNRVLSADERMRLLSPDPFYNGFVQPEPRIIYSIPRGDVLPTPPEVRTNIFESLTIGW